MRADPGLVRSDRHDRQIVRAPIPQWTKSGSPGRVSAKNDLFPFALDHVAVVAAMFVMLPAGPPMVHLEGFHVHLSMFCGDALLFAPAEFADVFSEAGSSKQIGSVTRTYHFGA